MPQLPYSPVPEVDPTSRAPDDYQRLSVSPDTFGAGVGQAAQSFGQNVQQAAQNVIKIGDIYDDAAAQNALNQFQERTIQTLHGGGSQTAGPDGRMQPSPGYLSLQGQEALNGRPAVEKSINDTMKEIGGTLKSPLAQRKFQESAERYKLSAFGQIGSHSEAQAQNWYKEVNKATEATALTGISTNAENPTELANFTADLISARVKNVQLEGGAGSPELVNAAVESGKRDALKAQTEAIAVHNPARAMDILDKNKTIAGTYYDELATKFRTRANQQTGDAAADAAMAQASFEVSNPPPASSAGIPNERVSAAILQQESGGNPNAPTSASGAEGIGQIIPATFQRYAKPGEDIKVPADNATVSKRIVDDYMTKYNGDPQRVAVAYFSGEGNVAPPGSPTPWVSDTSDKTGKTVSSYVADMSKRLGYNTNNLEAADREMKLTPQEKALYERHLGNVAGSGGVTNTDGSRSTLFATTAEIDGKTYVIPTVWDGKIIPPKEAIDKAIQGGIDQFPSYASQGEAEARYSKMHEFMEQDVVQAQHGPEAVQGRIASARANALQAVLNNKDLTPEARSLAINRVEQVARAQSVAAEQDARAKKAANDLSADKYVKAMLDPTKLGPQLLHEIQNDANLTWETRRALGEAVEKQSGMDEARAYGPGFWKAFDSVTAAPGTPGRITDVNQLLSRAAPGGDLTLAGVERLRQTQNEMMKPENAATAEMKKGALAYAKNQLSFEFEIGNFKMADPKGMDDFNTKLVPAFYDAFDKGIQAGKTPYQLLSKDSSDFIVDKLVSTYKRPEAQLMKDKMEAGMTGAQTGAVKKGEPDTNTPDGLRNAVRDGKVTKEDGARIAIEKGWARAAANIPAVPMQ